MRTKILALCVLALAGCERKDGLSRQQVEQSQVVTVVGQEGRIKVQRIDTVYDTLAYTSYRGVYLITDTKTGQEFVGVSGVGVSELGSHSSGKSSISDER